jgi:hypothetical protein
LRRTLVLVQSLQRIRLLPYLQLHTKNRQFLKNPANRCNHLALPFICNFEKTEAMLAKELRIGNWFEDDQGNYHQIEPAHLEFLLDNHLAAGKKIKPILLSHEIMIALNFEVTNVEGKEYGKRWTYKKNDFEVYDAFTNPACFLTTITFEYNFNYRNFKKHVVYLHQLQNLYYDLTGKELKLNVEELKK